MTLEVWRNGDGLFHIVQGDESLPEWILEGNPEFCYIVEGDDWNECMAKHFETQGWSFNSITSKYYGDTI